MINSFYFISLISDRPINLDWGLLFDVDWLNQSSRMKPFCTRYFFDNQTIDLVKDQTMISAA
jgi:hypothetical protein